MSGGRFGRTIASLFPAAASALAGEVLKAHNNIMTNFV